MKPATRPPNSRDDTLLIAIDAIGGALDIRRIGELAELLDPGDVVVLNDAATFPGLLSLESAALEPIELRLVSVKGKWARAVALGRGSWRDDTDHRSPPPPLAAGDLLLFAGDPVAKVVTADSRLIDIEFLVADPHAFIYKRGSVVQYSYVEEPLDLWSVQTSYASRPVAAEMPSAGRPLSWATLLSLRKRGVELVRLTHAAGLSASGDRELDDRLPLDEWYDIPKETIATIARAKEQGRRVIAVGTTVVRALESAVRNPEGLKAGEGCATLRISDRTELRIVDAILTGMHEVGSSHFKLLGAFAPSTILRSGWNLARDRGFRSHELGDVALLGDRFVGD